MEAATKDKEIEMASSSSAADSEPNNCSNSEFEKEETMMASSSNNQGKSFNSMGLKHYSAAAGGRFKEFEHLDSKALAKILTPNAGETPLYLAAERGYADVLDQILTTCTSPADHGPYNRTALHVAVIRKDEDMVERFLGQRMTVSENDSNMGEKGMDKGTCAVLHSDRNLAISACVVPVAMSVYLGLGKLLLNWLSRYM
ncbi:hypothetical protein Q3G72_017177 [Acer saccharum]|nr:hypothetical protein Q3G72_017177 [Acer saccharum]